MGGGVALLLDCLPGIYEALGSITGTEKPTNHPAKPEELTTLQGWNP